MYVVLNEHTLAYRLPATPNLLGVLAGSVLRGGHNPLNGSVSISERDHLRPATHADFDAYRVCSRGHLPPTDAGVPVPPSNAPTPAAEAV